MDKKQTAGIRSDENSEVQQNFADILKKAEPGSAFIFKKPELGSGFSLSGEHKTARSGRNSVPGYLLLPPRAEPSSGVLFAAA